MKSRAQKFFILSFLVFFLQPAFSQDHIAKAVYKCESLIQKGIEGYNGTNTLYFTAEKSLYIHNDYPKKDEYGGLGTNSISFTKGDSEGSPIFTDRKEGVVYFKVDYYSPIQSYILKEKIPVINWSILPESRKIGTLQAIHAKGVFGGRTYNVWFTPDIPLPYGPNKFGGLPGLILEVYSEDGFVKYKFQSFESNTKDLVVLEKPKSGKEITDEEFRTFVINDLLSVEALSTDQVKVTNGDPIPDYEIEKNKYFYITEYKRQRDGSVPANPKRNK
jgi:GLPGLI family protein